jgi:hypothetical protein
VTDEGKPFLVDFECVGIGNRDHDLAWFWIHSHRHQKWKRELLARWFGNTVGSDRIRAEWGIRSAMAYLAIRRLRWGYLTQGDDDTRQRQPGAAGRRAGRWSRVVPRLRLAGRLRGQADSRNGRAARSAGDRNLPGSEIPAPLAAAPSAANLRHSAPSSLGCRTLIPWSYGGYAGGPGESWAWYGRCYPSAMDLRLSPWIPAGALRRRPGLRSCSGRNEARR